MQFHPWICEIIALDIMVDGDRMKELEILSAMQKSIYLK